MKKILLITAIMFFADHCLAQYYRNAVGIRAGGSAGVFYKSFHTESMAYQALVSARNGGAQATGLYTRHLPTKLSHNLFFYYGGGAHVGFERYESNRRRRVEFNTISTNVFNTQVNNFNPPKYFSMGIDAIVGLEYRFTAPITLGFDVKPRFSFLGMRFTRFEFWDASLTFSFLI
ncbi:hypothetical protein QQ020_20795 [Fulvivirgaceae bacterium BMA12]|uniref:Outer membrane protein beta-barrel domain-containing protein n=1 Tax=Agaribacillus aureus TaxID=3051825 RepID=A0ABT8L9V1_9BACT|nr:hypothetical protein [Fulvivirgaceae bacterium BMA12]